MLRKNDTDKWDKVTLSCYVQRVLHLKEPMTLSQVEEKACRACSEALYAAFQVPGSSLISFVARGDSKVE